MENTNALNGLLTDPGLPVVIQVGEAMQKEAGCAAAASKIEELINTEAACTTPWRMLGTKKKAKAGAGKSVQVAPATAK